MRWRRDQGAVARARRDGICIPRHTGLSLPLTLASNIYFNFIFYQIAHFIKATVCEINAVRVRLIRFHSELSTYHVMLYWACLICN
jgi:hypothetical protein